MTKNHFLLVGLGNPGSKYALHRHNAGYIVVQEMACILDLKFSKKFGGELAEFSTAGKDFSFFNPTSEYMNNSGVPVATFAKFYKVDPKNILVIHDELDFPSFKVKFKLSGGTGGHNGLLSLKQSLGSDNFQRLRIGVDKPKFQSAVVNYVLGNLSEPEIKFLKALAKLLTSSVVSIWSEVGRQHFVEKANEAKKDFDVGDEGAKDGKL